MLCPIVCCQRYLFSIVEISLLMGFIKISDAGKSTIGGQIMSLTGMVDKRTLEKYEREAREKSRESWYLSWALDTNQEGERFFGWHVHSSLFYQYSHPVTILLAIHYCVPVLLKFLFVLCSFPFF